MDPDFEFQLRCQAQESDKKVSEGTSASSLSDASGTYTDPQDGTVYEWDRAKKAWFPKVSFVLLWLHLSDHPLPIRIVFRLMKTLLPCIRHPMVWRARQRPLRWRRRKSFVV